MKSKLKIALAGSAVLFAASTTGCINTEGTWREQAGRTSAGFSPSAYEQQQAEIDRAMAEVKKSRKK